MSINSLFNIIYYQIYYSVRRKASFSWRLTFFLIVNLEMGLLFYLFLFIAPLFSHLIICWYQPVYLLFLQLITVCLYRLFDIIFYNSPSTSQKYFTIYLYRSTIFQFFSNFSGLFLFIHSSSKKFQRERISFGKQKEKKISANNRKGIGNEVHLKFSNNFSSFFFIDGFLSTFVPLSLFFLIITQVIKILFYIFFLFSNSSTFYSFGQFDSGIRFEFIGIFVVKICMAQSITFCRSVEISKVLFFFFFCLIKVLKNNFFILR